MNIDTLVLLLFFKNISNYFWMITWIKNVNNFQIAKVQPSGICLAFCQFQSAVIYKSLAYKKTCICNLT